MTDSTPIVRTLPFVGSMWSYRWIGSNSSRRSAISRTTSSMRAAALPCSWTTRHAFFFPAGAPLHSRYASSTMERSILRPLQYVFISDQPLWLPSELSFPTGPVVAGHFRQLTRHARSGARGAVRVVAA